jgi:6-pyruvoyltetrahydropterin/6-carboxytetrahydropterin synthase
MHKKIYLTRSFHFDAAHKVVDYNGKCENLHGHTYLLKVTISGELKENGMVLDFATLKKKVKELIDKKLDHKYLNEEFDNPTTENVAIFIFNSLEKVFKTYGCLVYEVSLSEGLNNTVIVKK